MATPAPPPAGPRERRNWLLHTLYVRGDAEAAGALADEMLRAAGGLSE
jgi:Bardet-Biedl syndrome 4 protein